MFNETKVWNLLYELVGYKHMTIIIDEDGISIADLDDIATNPPINAPIVITDRKPSVKRCGIEMCVQKVCLRD